MNLAKNEQGIAHIAVLAVVVAALIGVSGYYVSTKQPKSSSVKNSTSLVSSRSTLAAPLPADLLSTDKVKELALAQKPGTTVLGVQLESEDGVLVYKVKLSDGSTLSFNAQTGAAVTAADDTELDGAATLPANQTATIDFAKARALALAAHPGTVQKIELENEEGSLVFSVRFTDGARVAINAVDGSVVRNQSSKDSPSTSSKQSDDSSNSSSNSDNSGSGSHDSGSNTNSSTTPTTQTETHNSAVVDDSSHGGNSSGKSGSGSSH